MTYLLGMDNILEHHPLVHRFQANMVLDMWNQEDIHFQADNDLLHQ